MKAIFVVRKTSLIIEMSQKQVRKRGENYTQEEKSLLLDLIMQFKHIVECKRTGAIYIQKKKEAWNIITQKYNSSCSSGSRDMEQLKALYDNMKQKSRKDLGESNKLAYINAEQNRLVTEDDVTQALQHIKEDKIQMHKTGGGFWKPKMTDNEAKVLAIIQDQVEPLSNPYDSASFFKESMDLTVTAEEVHDVIEIVQPYASTSCAPTQEMAENGQEWQTPIRSGTPSSSNIVTPLRGKINKKKALKPKKLLKTTSAEDLKRLYFKKKCQNADLERKKLMLEVLHHKQEHNLRMVV